MLKTTAKMDQEVNSCIIISVTKYQEYFKLMLENNKDLFNEFKLTHDKYGLDKDKLQDEFNKIGSKVQTVIREWEDKLCGRSEGSGYASYSGNLAQKFQDEIRKSFPLIDNIGIIVTQSIKTQVSKEDLNFNLKKINL